MIIDKDEYLEHFGTKGMKWGVRKDRSAGGKSPPKKPKQPLTPQQIQTRVNIGLAVMGGAIFVAKIVAANHNVKVANARGASALRAEGGRQRQAQRLVGLAGGQPVRSREATDWLRKNKMSGTKVSDIRPPAAAKKKLGEMSPETKKFMADFTAKQNSLIKGANDDLLSRDNALQIPFPAREYLKSWTMPEIDL